MATEQRKEEGTGRVGRSTVAEGSGPPRGRETFGLRVDLGSQDVKLTQDLTLRSQLRFWSAPYQRSFGFVAERLSLDGVKSERHGNPTAAPKIPKRC